MPLIKNDEIVEDRWVSLNDEADVPPVSERLEVIVSLERWRTEGESLAGRGGPLGIRLRSDQAPSSIAEDLHRFDLVALEFPAFKDGRAYSYARLLRERYAFTGEIRAVGQVLRDQSAFMKRCGFDAFEVADETAAAAWRAAAGEISVRYQPASDRRSWASLQRHGSGALAEREVEPCSAHWAY